MNSNCHHISHEKEQLLITRSKKNIGHFEPLYNHYFPMIYRYLFRRCGNESLTADLCSNTFLSAMTHLHQYHHRPGISFGSWLFRIALNELRKYFRDRREFFLIEEEKLPITSDLEEIKSFDESVLTRLFDQLNDNELRLIELRYFEEASFKEMSRLLNRTESAVKMSLYRLLAKLRAVVRNDNDEKRIPDQTVPFQKRIHQKTPGF